MPGIEVARIWNPIRPVRVGEFQFGSPEHEGNASRRYLVRPSDEAAQIIDRASGEVVRTITAEEGHQFTGVIVDDERVSWLDLEHATNSRMQIFEARLPDGEARSIESFQDAFTPGVPNDYDRLGDVVAYSTQDRQRTNCVAEFNLRTERSRLVYCTPRKVMGAGMARLTSHGVVFSVWTPEPKPNGCTSLMGERDGKLQRLPSVRRCDSTTGIGGGDFWVWSEQRGSVAEFADMMASAPGGEIYWLGRGNTSTETLCGRWAYWLAVVGNQTELRRWQPGGPIEVLYRTPKKGVTGLYGLTCYDGRLHVVQPQETSLIEHALEFRPTD